MKKNKPAIPPTALKGAGKKQGSDYSDQWDIIPKDESQWRAAVIYEYSRESPLLLELINGLLKNGILQVNCNSDSNIPTLEFLHYQSPFLALMVTAAYVNGSKTAWSKKWSSLTCKQQKLLVESLPLPVREATREELRAAVIQGEKDCIDKGQLFSPKSLGPNGLTYMEPMPLWTTLKSDPLSEDPRCIVALNVDSSLSAAMFRKAINEYLDLVLKPLPSPGGPNSGSNHWKKKLLNLSGLRLRSTRKIEVAKTICSSVPEENRPFHDLKVPLGDPRDTKPKPSETTERRRPREAVETFSELFPLLLPMNSEEIPSDAMISLRRFNLNNPRSQITSLKKPK